MYDIGILGGMGPKATSLLFQLIVENTRASCDQKHISVFVANKTNIPDRSAYLLGYSAQSPLPALLEGVKDLEAVGAKNLLMPCNTTHYFYDEIAASTKMRCINMVERTLCYISRSSYHKKVVILGTLGTVQTRVYEKYNAYDLSVLYPTPEECETIHDIIYRVKTAKQSDQELADELLPVMQAIEEREKEVTFVLACTELSCFGKMLSVKSNIVDAMDLLALVSIYMVGKEPTKQMPYDYETIEAISNEKGVTPTNGK